jgi:hypothetical protein
MAVLGERVGGADGFDARRAGADRRSSDAPANRPFNVVAGLDFVVKLLDQLVGDLLAACVLAIGPLRHHHSPVAGARTWSHLHRVDRGLPPVVADDRHRL